jgi:hypothetical protein
LKDCPKLLAKVKQVEEELPDLYIVGHEKES